jgi:hypothetical protein
VHDPACADVEEGEHVQPLKGGRHHDEEVAGDDGSGMIAEEGRPGLRRAAITTSRSRRHVASHRARETVGPRFTRSSAAMRSSPQVWLCVAMSAMSRRAAIGMRGRPRCRDFTRQKRRKRSRCHRQASPVGQSLRARASRRSARAARVRFGKRLPCGAVEPGVRYNRPAASGEINSRRPIARATGTSDAATARVQRRGRATLEHVWRWYRDQSLAQCFGSRLALALILAGHRSHRSQSTTHGTEHLTDIDSKAAD